MKQFYPGNLNSAIQASQGNSGTGEVRQARGRLGAISANLGDLRVARATLGRGKIQQAADSAERLQKG